MTVIKDRFDALVTIAAFTTLAIFLFFSTFMINQDSLLASRIGIVERLSMEQRRQLVEDNHQQDLRIRELEQQIDKLSAEVERLKPPQVKAARRR